MDLAVSHSLILSNSVSTLISLYGPRPVRAQFACDYCRRRKAKVSVVSRLTKRRYSTLTIGDIPLIQCSGTEPCTRCESKGRECVFSTVRNQRKVAVSLKDIRAERAALPHSMSRPGVRKMHTEHASAPHRGGSGADVLNGRRLVHPQGHHIYGATLDWRLRPANGDRGPEPSSSQSAPIMQSSTFSTPSWTGSPHDQLWSHGSVTYGSYYNGGSHMPQGTMAHSDEASTTFHQASHYGAGVLHTSDAHNFPLPHTSPIGLGLSLGGSDYNVPANQFAAAVPASRSNNTDQQQPHSHLFSPTGNGAGQQPQIVGYQQQTERGHVTSRSNEPHEPPLDAHTATSASAQVCGLRTAASAE